MTRQEYKDANDGGTKPPSVSSMDLGNRYPSIRNNPNNPWLTKVSAGIVRDTVCHRLSDAYSACRHGKAKPKFHSRSHANQSFDMYGCRIQVDGANIRIEKIGWMTLRGEDPYGDQGAIKQVTVKKELDKWYAYLVRELDDTPKSTGTDVVGIDRGVAVPIQCSDGTAYHLPDTSLLEAKKKRYQRRISRQVKGSKRYNRTRLRAAKCYRKLKYIKRNWAHHVSKDVASKAPVVALEKLNVKSMTAKGGSRKKGLNREINKSAWGTVARMLDYKARKTVYVRPHHTSQICSSCGYRSKANRVTRSRFECQSCGFIMHADLNASINIAERALSEHCRKRKKYQVLRPDKAGHLHGERRSHKRPLRPVNHTQSSRHPAT